MSHAIRVQDLQVHYRNKKGAKVHAVRGLSFSVEPGEVVGFLGPNGAGKSSTLKALMGFVEPSGGTSEVFGFPAGSLEAKRRVGYLPEVALYYPFLTPLETLTLYGELQGLFGAALKKEATDLLWLVGLENALHKQNRTLSKGMLQRVGIAQSLLGSPDLLVLDEVTSGLDPVGRRELRQLLKDRQKQGATLFFSSHELSEVDMICDRILVIHEGVMVEERIMSELKEDLRDYCLTFSGKEPLAVLGEGWTVANDGAFQKRFRTKDELLAAVERVYATGGKVLDIVSREASLEDYFIDTVRRAA